MNDQPSARRNPVGVFFGWLLLSVGVLIAGTAGLCTLAVLGVSLNAGGALGDLVSVALMALIFGGVPFVVGTGLGFIGWMIVRKKR